MKYYGTLMMMSIPDEILTKYNVTDRHGQYRVVCKARSRAEANRILESITGYKRVFNPNSTSETGNRKEIAFAYQYGVIIDLDGYGDYYSLKILMNEINAYKSV